MCALGGADSLDPATLRAAVDEADCLDAFLAERFDALHGRAEIPSVEFDRPEAAHALRTYLGA
jgi:hypothetical protein